MLLLFPVLCYKNTLNDPFRNRYHQYHPGNNRNDSCPTVVATSKLRQASQIKKAACAQIITRRTLNLSVFLHHDQAQCEYQ